MLRRSARVAGSLIVAATAISGVLVGPSPQHARAALTAIAVADSLTMKHDRTAVVPAPGVLGNDLNLLGGATAILVSGVSHGSLTLRSDGGYTYTPAAGYVGTDSFRYHPSGLLYTSATVTITITNAAPVPHPDAYSGAAQTTLVVPAPGVLANDSDADGDALVAERVGGITGSLDLQPNGGFEYTPGGGFSGTATFTYRVWDGVVWSGTTTVTLTIVAPTPIPSPMPTPTPSPSPTPRPTASPSPTPSLPIPSLPIPSLPLPTIPSPTPTPSLPTLPLPTPSPTPVPWPTVPLPSIGLPGSSSPTPSGDPTASSSPNASASRDPAATASPAAPEAGGGGGTTAASGSDPSGSPSGGPDAAPRQVRLRAPETGLGLEALAVLTGLDTWIVPAAVIAGPGLIVLLWIALQAAGALAWIPATRRLRDGDVSTARR